MSKCKLIFDLSDSDDNQKLERMMKTDDMCIIIWDFLYNSRKRIQQEIALSEGEITASEAIDKCFERFGELLNENSVDIDKIWS